MVRDIRWNGLFRLFNREKFNPKFRKIFLSTNGPFDGGTKDSDSCSQELKSLYCTYLGYKGT
jgi:hypothetical protein